MPYGTNRLPKDAHGAHGKVAAAAVRPFLSVMGGPAICALAGFAGLKMNHVIFPDVARYNM